LTRIENEEDLTPEAVGKMQEAFSRAGGELVNVPQTSTFEIA
jgi:hypothetical protein